MRRATSSVIASVLLLSCLAGPALAQLTPRTEALGDLAGTFDVSQGLAVFQPRIEFDSARLTVKRVGEGIVFQQSFAPAAALTYAFVDAEGRALADGLYRYEVLFVRSPELGAEGVVTKAYLPKTVSGPFEIRGGALVVPEELGGGTASLERLASPLEKVTAADVVVADDQIVEGSICASSTDECADGESFTVGAQVAELKLKSGKVGIWFDDTDGDFDWAMGTVTNNVFFIASLAGTDTTPFIIEGDAPDSAFFIDSTGSIGLGTSTPADALHATGAKTVIRLQNTTSGETWRIGDFLDGDLSFTLFATNNGGVSTGEKMVIQPTGNVGIGAAIPDSQLHLARSNGASLKVQDTSGTTAERVLYRLENKGKTRFAVNNTNLGIEWTFDNDGNFRISKVGTGVNEFTVDGSGNVFATGTFNTVSSREAKKEVAPVDTEEILSRVVNLPLAEWTYQKEDPTIRHLGPMAEDFHAAFGLGHDNKQISLLDGTGVALASIQGLHRVVEEKTARIQELEASNQELAARLAALEVLVRQLATEEGGAQE